MCLLRQFYPDEYLDSAYEVDYEGLYREGYRGVIFDIDNTLVPHGAPADSRPCRDLPWCALRTARFSLPTAAL